MPRRTPRPAASIAMAPADLSFITSPKDRVKETFENAHEAGRRQLLDASYQVDKLKCPFKIAQLVSRSRGSMKRCERETNYNDKTSS